MSKDYVLSDKANVVLTNKDTGEVVFKGEALTQDIEITQQSMRYSNINSPELPIPKSLQSNKYLYILLHEMDFDGAFKSSSIGGYVFESLEKAKNELLNNGYTEHEDWTFAKLEDGIYDYVSIVETLLK